MIRYLVAFGMVLGLLGPAVAQKAPSQRFQAIDVADRVNAKGVNVVSDGTSMIPIDAFWAGVGNPNLIRYVNHFKLTSKYDGEAWESALGVDCQFQTGYSFPYQSGMAVTVGQNIQSAAGNPEPYTYRVTQAGNLGTTGPTAGPGSAAFASGTARLQWINYTNLATKLCFTSTTFMSGNAGSSWGANFNFHMRPLSNQPKFVSGIEQDFHNDSGYDCLLFSGNTCNAYNMYLTGSNRATVGLNIGKTNANPVFANEWALALQGPYLSRDAIISINTTASTVGIGIGRYAGILGASTYTAATYRDESTSPVAISIAGSNSDAGISTVGMVGGNGTAIRHANGQLTCWGNGLDACIYYAPAYGFLFHTTSGTSSTKFTLDPNGNFTAVGGVFATGYSAGGVAGVTCNAAPTSAFRTRNGIVTAC